MPLAVGNRKTCSRCRVEKPLDAFRLDNNKIDKLTTWCAACIEAVRNASRIANPAKEMWNGARLRAARRSTPFTVTIDDVGKMLEIGKCVYCDRHVECWFGRGRSSCGREDSASLDEIVWGRGYSVANTALCCNGCNRRKSSFTPTALREWADKIEALMAERGLEAAAE